MSKLIYINLLVIVRDLWEKKYKMLWGKVFEKKWFFVILGLVKVFGLRVYVICIVENVVDKLEEWW